MNYTPLKIFTTIMTIYVVGAVITHLGCRVLEVLSYLRSTEVDNRSVTVSGIKRAWGLENGSDTLEYVLFMGTLFWPFAWIANFFIYPNTVMWMMGYPFRAINVRVPYWLTLQGFADRVNKKREARR